MPSVNELISAGYGGYAGWGDAEANADFNATGGNGKQTSGGGSSGGGGGVSIPAFTWTPAQQAAAEAEALKTLTPYYQKLLDMYGGDVALAKQRLDQDYERGLRVKTENTEWEKGTNDIAVAERQRKFKIALTDIDQQMNQRGVYTSGITDAEKQRATADEMYQQDQLKRNNMALDTGLKQYTEGANADYRKGAEDLGFAKPMDTALVGQYTPSQAGITAPGSSYVLGNYAPQTAQKELALEEQKRKDMEVKALNSRSQAYEKWSADATRLMAAG
jgi:hypothetical protein